MKLSLKILWLVFIISCSCLHKAIAQDTSRYYQDGESLFYNCYVFLRAHTNDTYGTFTQVVGSDDIQHWIGFGAFTETKHKITLSFNKLNDSTRIVFTRSTKSMDSLYVTWTDIDSTQEVFSIQSGANPKHEKPWYLNFSTYVVMPKKELINNTFSFSIWNAGKIMDIKIPANDINVVTIFYNDSNHVHDIHKTKEILKKSGNGFITRGEWVKNKKVHFSKH